MEGTYICRACREALRNGASHARSRIPQTRKISYGPSPSQANGSHGQPVQREVRGGRYSRRPLDPEELLGTLGDTQAGRDKPRERQTDWGQNPGNPPRRPAYAAQPGRESRFKTPLNLLAERHDGDLSTFRVRLQEFERVPREDREKMCRTTGGVFASRMILSKLLWRWAHHFYEAEDGSEPRFRFDKGWPDFGSPSQIIAYMQKLGMMHAGNTTFTLMRMAQWTYALPPDLLPKPDPQHVFLRETLRSWHAYIQAHLRPGQEIPQSIDATEFDWSFLPSAEALIEECSDIQPLGRFEKAMSKLTPRVDFITNRPLLENTDIACAALLMFASLKQTGPRSCDLSRDAASTFPEHAPFINLLEAVLDNSTSTKMPNHVAKTLHSTQPDNIRDLYQSLTDKFRLVERRNVDVVNGQVASKPITDNSEHSSEVVDLKDDSFTAELEKEDSTFGKIDLDTRSWVVTRIRRLGRGTETQDLSRIDNVWKEVQLTQRSLPHGMYEHLMMACLAMRRPALAIEVWNKMVTAGLAPRVHTYVVMMRGCQAGKDVNAMEALWKRMRSSGMQPDNYAWTTRIFGLCRSGKAQQGLRALEEMGNEWIQAVVEQHKTTMPKASKAQAASTKSQYKIDWAQYTGSVNGIPKPDVIAMNAAVSALAKTSDKDIPRALKLGRTFGVDLDLTTYNTLLNVSMRHGQISEALNLIQAMQSKGIAPDNTTFTVLTTSLFQSNFLADLSPSEQQTKITTLLSSLSETTGLTPDPKTYALIIDRLLKQHSNPTAAQAILNHMLAKNVQPTPHVYTILMTSYFSSSPPDFAAAENLWHQTQNTPSGYPVALDTVFYDRMVENYAVHHGSVGTGPMLMFLARMSREGKRVSWRALEYVARALAERGDWGRLRGVVDDVRSESGGRLVGRAGMLGMSGQRSFWHFVWDTGVLEGEGIGSVEELIKTKGGSSFPEGLTEMEH